MPWAWAVLVPGVCLLVLTWASVVKTLLMPGYVPSRITRLIARGVLLGFRVAGSRITSLDRRERLLGAGPPVFLLTLLGAWAALLYLSFALILMPFAGASVPAALRMSGSSLFTLGFAVPAGAASYAIAFAAAISGMGVIALLIGYMPTLYGAYNRRETLVTMLEALSGSPPWGPELLARQQVIKNVGYLPRLYERWAEWAADISESHSTYRTLIYFRSRNPLQAWPLALLAVLDAAALHLALCPGSAPAEARPLLRIGFTAMRTIATTLGVPVNEDPRPSDRWRSPGPSSMPPSRAWRRRGGRSNGSRTRHGRTSGAGGSITRPPPTTSPRTWTCRPRRGRDRGPGWGRL